MELSERDRGEDPQRSARAKGDQIISNSYRQLGLCLAESQIKGNEMRACLTCLEIVSCSILSEKLTNVQLSSRIHESVTLDVTAMLHDFRKAQMGDTNITMDDGDEAVIRAIVQHTLLDAQLQNAIVTPFAIWVYQLYALMQSDSSYLSPGEDDRRHIQKEVLFTLMLKAEAIAVLRPLSAAAMLRALMHALHAHIHSALHQASGDKLRSAFGLIWDYVDAIGVMNLTLSEVFKCSEVITLADCANFDDLASQVLSSTDLLHLIREKQLSWQLCSALTVLWCAGAFTVEAVCDNIQTALENSFHANGFALAMALSTRLCLDSHLLTELGLPDDSLNTWRKLVMNMRERLKKSIYRKLAHQLCVSCQQQRSVSFVKRSTAATARCAGIETICPENLPAPLTRAPLGRDADVCSLPDSIVDDSAVSVTESEIASQDTVRFLSERICRYMYNEKETDVTSDELLQLQSILDVQLQTTKEDLAPRRPPFLPPVLEGDRVPYQGTKNRNGISIDQGLNTLGLTRNSVTMSMNKILSSNASKKHHANKFLSDEERSYCEYETFNLIVNQVLEMVTLDFRDKDVTALYMLFNSSELASRIKSAFVDGPRSMDNMIVRKREQVMSSMNLERVSTRVVNTLGVKYRDSVPRLGQAAANLMRSEPGLLLLSQSGLGAQPYQAKGSSRGRPRGRPSQSKLVEEYAVIMSPAERQHYIDSQYIRTYHPDFAQIVLDDGGHRDGKGMFRIPQSSATRLEALFFSSDRSLINERGARKKRVLHRTLAPDILSLYVVPDVISLTASVVHALSTRVTKTLMVSSDVEQSSLDQPPLDDYTSLIRLYRELIDPHFLAEILRFHYLEILALSQKNATKHNSSMLSGHSRYLFACLETLSALSNLAVCEEVYGDVFTWDVFASHFSVAVYADERVQMVSFNLLDAVVNALSESITKHEATSTSSVHKSSEEGSPGMYLKYILSLYQIHEGVNTSAHRPAHHTYKILQRWLNHHITEESRSEGFLINQVGSLTQVVPSFECLWNILSGATDGVRENANSNESFDPPQPSFVTNKPMHTSPVKKRHSQIVNVIKDIHQQILLPLEFDGNCIALIGRLMLKLRELCSDDHTSAGRGLTSERLCKDVIRAAIEAAPKFSICANVTGYLTWMHTLYSNVLTQPMPRLLDIIQSLSFHGFLTAVAAGSDKPISEDIVAMTKSFGHLAIFMKLIDSSSPSNAELHTLSEEDRAQYRDYVHPWLLHAVEIITDALVVLVATFTHFDPTLKISWLAPDGEISISSSQIDSHCECGTTIVDTLKAAGRFLQDRMAPKDVNALVSIAARNVGVANDAHAIHTLRALLPRHARDKNAEQPQYDGTFCEKNVSRNSPTSSLEVVTFSQPTATVGATPNKRKQSDCTDDDGMIDAIDSAHDLSGIDENKAINLINGRNGKSPRRDMCASPRVSNSYGSLRNLPKSQNDMTISRRKVETMPFPVFLDDGKGDEEKDTSRDTSDDLIPEIHGTFAGADHDDDAVDGFDDEVLSTHSIPCAGATREGLSGGELSGARTPTIPPPTDPPQRDGDIVSHQEHDINGNEQRRRDDGTGHLDLKDKLTPQTHTTQPAESPSRKNVAQDIAVESWSNTSDFSKKFGKKMWGF